MDEIINDHVRQDGWTPAPVPEIYQHPESGEENTSSRNADSTKPKLQIRENESTAEQDEERWAAFAGLEETQRFHYAARYCEAILGYDASGTLRKVYAPGLFSEALNIVGIEAVSAYPALEGVDSRLRELAQRAMNSQALQRDEIVLKFPPNDKPLTLPVVCRPCLAESPETIHSYAFVALKKAWIDLCILSANREETMGIWEECFVKYKPNLRGNILTNNFGFYDDDFSVPKPQGVYRILCVGGSTTEGRRSKDKSYPEILEEHFDTIFGHDIVDVCNCGTAGINSIGHLLRLEDYFALEPDLIVLYVGINDIAWYMGACNEICRTPLPKILSKSVFLQRFCGRMFYPADQEIKRFQKAMTLRNMQVFVDEAHKKGIEVAICSFPYPEPGKATRRETVWFDYDAAHNWSQGSLNWRTYALVMSWHNVMIREFCATQKLTYIPAYEALGGVAKNFIDIAHTSRIGTTLKAECVFQSVNHFVTEYLERSQE